MNTRRPSGFTLLELMIALTVAGIIMASSIPSMRNYIRNNRLTGAANDLLHSIQVARSEAVKRQLAAGGNVVVCGTSNPTVADAALTCNNTTFAGWFVFQDTNGDWVHGAAEPVLERHALVDPSVTIIADRSRILSYMPTGFGSPGGAGLLPTTRIVICDARGIIASGTNTVGATSTARALIIQPTGRARVSNQQADVVAAQAVIGASCP